MFDTVITSSQMREFEVNAEISAVFKVISNWMAIPLYLVFWLADCIYAPALKWEFLALRLTIIPVCIIAKKILDHERSAESAQWVAAIFGGLVALPINVMIGLLPEVTTTYYAGLNLVALGGLSFLPFTLPFFLLTAGLIFIPYYAIVIYGAHSTKDWLGILINTFFITGTILICYLIRFFHERMRLREIHSRMALKTEIVNRDNIIKRKTAEAVRLNSLKTQFSPRTAQAIYDGHMDHEKSIRQLKICAVMIDIVDSDQHVLRLDYRKVDNVLARFMDTVLSIFLKYDLTIDKFQGDGILAFSNDSDHADDFIQKTCLAALDVRQALLLDSEFYQFNWRKKMQVRIGISAGEANVGFYGDQKYFRSYTAIGIPLRLSTRLASLARPEQIILDSTVAKILETDGFEIEKLGKLFLKGFEHAEQDLFELVNAPECMMFDSEHCPSCQKSYLQISTNEHGHYLLSCSLCNYEKTELATSE
ncbi:adenylate/guanylate cyclase domain-containing protein [Bdellovibrio sp. SKB1291214]|uniref:adenylate/guanylate cyclase domain-containing protein n=1 Tax=Bdellovibrio sp. SKB1291214 TaxID=1732569 RepID=UPI002240BA02|nr:adenylate/guanylate cyclase domain-containing protein [Bdellovibrio sp. SKB1291214]UYL07464.1 adenylate/guanylate cyclase domain-containing protein [Bdellovibrio sp. SKB1291214]